MVQSTHIPQKISLPLPARLQTDLKPGRRLNRLQPQPIPPQPDFIQDNLNPSIHLQPQSELSLALGHPERLLESDT